MGVSICSNIQQITISVRKSNIQYNNADTFPHSLVLSTVSTLAASHHSPFQLEHLGLENTEASSIIHLLRPPLLLPPQPLLDPQTRTPPKRTNTQPLSLLLLAIHPSMSHKTTIIISGLESNAIPSPSSRVRCNRVISRARSSGTVDFDRGRRRGR